MDMEEYKLLNGWSRDRKKGSSRYDRLPGKLRDIVRLESRKDYLYFLPESLPEEFTSMDLARCARIPRDTAQTCLLILRDLGIIELIGKKGRFHLHRIAI